MSPNLIHITLDLGNKEQTVNKENTADDMLIAQMDAVITGSADGTAKIWSLYSGECLFVSLVSTQYILNF